MATPSTTEKKPNPNAPKPKQQSLMIGAILIVLAGGWALYEWNPAGMVRAETQDERKDRQDEERATAERAKKEKEETERAEKIRKAIQAGAR